MSKNKETESLSTEEVEDTKVDVEVESDKETSEESSEKASEDKPTEEPEVELTVEEKLTNRVAELEDSLTRKIAEFENYKKRTARQHEDMVKFANEKTIGEILDVIDNFDRALAQQDENVTLESFAEGIKMIHSQLHAVIDKYDVKPIEAMGKQFDPNLHEALMHVESDEFDEGVIAFEMNKGYTMGGKVIRHSRVGVAKPKAVEEEEKTEEIKDDNEDTKE